MAEQGCRYFGGEMKSTYKIGDKVKIVNPDKDYHHHKRFPIGTIGIVTHIDLDDNQTSPVIGITAGNKNASDEWWYLPREIRPYPYTNAEKIRLMSDEELAPIIMCPHDFYDRNFCNQNCTECCLEWLKQEAK